MGTELVRELYDLGDKLAWNGCLFVEAEVQKRYGGKYFCASELPEEELLTLQKTFKADIARQNRQGG